MKPIPFDDANIVLTSERGNVGNLPAHRGDGFWVSRWKPTLRERLSILLFGNVWCSIIGDKHPPLAIYGGRAARFVMPESTED